MKKIYGIIGVVCLIFIVVVLSALKNNNETNNVSKILDSSDLFTERDLLQSIDTINAREYNVSDGENIKISTEGTYVISGTANNVTIYVEAQDSDKVQIILKDVNITNETLPVIYVKNADKVFVNINGSNTLKVIGTFSKVDDNLNAVIFSKQDIIFNGTGDLIIESTQNGITGKDDIKITGGTYTIKSTLVGIRANDSIRIADGNIEINAGSDGLHAENSSDDTKGYIYIATGTLSIKATDDCIHGTSVVQIDDGKITIDGAEGIEGTYIQINGGTIRINAKDDGINAGSKSKSYNVTIEITNGDITIVMVSGDTDGIDSNGDLIVSGGIINVIGNSTFDYDGESKYTGGTIIINGTKVETIPNSAINGRSNKK